MTDLHPPPAPAATRFVPLSRTVHAALRWRKFQGYEFAANDFVVPVSLPEVARAAAHLPLVIVRRAQEHYEPVALLGLATGQNLLVGKTGAWAAEYVPAALRGRPFGIGITADRKSLMCIDEQSPLIGDEGEPFFTPEGKLTQEVQRIADFLGQLLNAQQAAMRAASALAERGCLMPLTFPEGVSHGLGKVDNLLQVNEAALDALPPASLAELRPLGALSLAYAQMVSWHHVPALARLAAVRQKEREAVPDLSLLDRDGTLVLGPID